EPINDTWKTSRTGCPRKYSKRGFVVPLECPRNASLGRLPNIPTNKFIPVTVASLIWHARSCVANAGVVLQRLQAASWVCAHARSADIIAIATTHVFPADRSDPINPSKSMRVSTTHRFTAVRQRRRPIGEHDLLAQRASVSIFHAAEPPQIAEPGC